MMIFPLAFFFFLFGVSNFSGVAYPLLLSLGNIVLIFLLGRLLFDEKVGLIAALAMAFYPLDVNYATWIMPDVPIAFFTGLSVFLFLKSRKEKKRSKILSLLSGISVGLAYLVKLSGLTIFVFYISYFLINCVLKSKKIDSSFLFIYLGFFLVFFMEGLYYYVTTHDFLLRIHSSFEYFTKKERLKYEFVTDFKFYPMIMFNLDNKFRFMWWNLYTYFGIFYYLVVFSIIFLLIKRIKKSFVIILWFVTVFFYLQFGTMSFKEYIPMHRLDRHLTLVSLPSILLFSIFLTQNGNNVKYLPSTIILFVLCGSFLIYISHICKIQRDATRDTKLIFEELKKLPKRVVYSDGGTIGHLMFYSEFKENHLYRILDFRDCDELKGSYVIVNATRGWIEFPEMLRKYPTCVFTRPKNWILIKTIKSDADSYPYDSFDPEIYLIL